MQSIGAYLLSESVSIGMLVGWGSGSEPSDRGLTTVSSCEFTVVGSNSKRETRKRETRFLYGHSFGIAIELAAEFRG